MEALDEVMRRGGCSQRQRERFGRKVATFLANPRGGVIQEHDLLPLEELDTIDESPYAPSLLGSVVILKLNGGLGTTMGLQRAKGLLWVKPGWDFYAIVIGQLRAWKERSGAEVPLLFMNSFATEVDTRERLSELQFSQELPWGFLQGRVPKIDPRGNPMKVVGDESLAWCPPGHGDLYASLLDTGLRDRLLALGKTHLFISNIDNVGATVDSRPLAYMHKHNLPFLMEVTRRTRQDRKGGHLARHRDGRFVLRESVQCQAQDRQAFEDLDRHRYFNTNNIWVRLDAIEESWTDLPIIINRKPIVPFDRDSPEAIQLESAMGAAIGVVAGATAIAVGRDRFLPVKTTNDLFVLRSNRYELNESKELRAVKNDEIVVDLDPEYYQMMEDFDRLVLGEPSLKECSRLRVRGPVVFKGGEPLVGDVCLENLSLTPCGVGDLLNGT